MYFISHRGNVSGPAPEYENSPAYIENASKLGFDVEIDVWLNAGNWWLGHDRATYETSVSFLSQPGLWIHAKNLEALWALVQEKAPLNFFWHQNDDAVLTSHKWVWTYPGRSLGPRSIYVMPETVPAATHAKLLKECNYQLAGVCSDHVIAYKSDLNWASGNSDKTSASNRS